NGETEVEFVDYGPKYSAFNSYKERTDVGMRFLETPTRFTVKTVSLDHYCRDKNIKPSAIKIDAEGAESLILEAMTDIIQNDKPIISIEVAGGEEWKDNCMRSITLLLAAGYCCFETSLEGDL